MTEIKNLGRHNIARLSRKKIKKAVKKVVVAEVRRVPSAFDLIVEPSRKVFFYCPGLT
jgi:hypothetical protein